MKDLSTTQLAELREAFDACDSNGDGWIVGAEFNRLLRALDYKARARRAPPRKSCDAHHSLDS